MIEIPLMFSNNSILDLCWRLYHVPTVRHLTVKHLVLILRMKNLSFILSILGRINLLFVKYSIMSIFEIFRNITENWINLYDKITLLKVLSSQFIHILDSFWANPSISKIFQGSCLYFLSLLQCYCHRLISNRLIKVHNTFIKLI